jgi:hypothetical protein
MTHFINRGGTLDDTAALEHELRSRIAHVLSMSSARVGVIVGTGLVLVKVANDDEFPNGMPHIRRRLVEGVLTSMGLSGNLYHIL